MEENTNITEQTTQAENMGNETEVQGATGADKEQKLFTQEEVNGFVKSQIARMMKKATKDQEAEYAQKAQELQAREMKLLVKEQLSERGMPRELADIITCTDEADIKSKLEALQKIYGSQSAAKEKEKPMGFIQIGAAGDNHVASSDPVRNAMGLN